MCHVGSLSVNEKMTNEWNKTIICPMYKKGEKSEYSNYRKWTG
jgi:hypothetical protein